MGELRTSLVGTHWGNFVVTAADGVVVGVRPHELDPNPSPIGCSLLDMQDPSVRIARPMVRAGWLDGRRRTGRGTDPFVAVSWDTALDLAAGELDTVRKRHGNAAIFGGSYGWASAGRFHHAQSQLHRFLNCIGGYTRAVDTYSAAAAEVIVPHVLGINPLIGHEPSWDEIAEQTDMLVCFGGICLHNSQVVPGGIASHTDRAQLERVAARQIEIVNVSPMREDVPPFMTAEWLPIRPSSDVALMLGIAHTLHSEGLHDAAFLDSHCVGFEKFVPYLTGESDGQPKDADWAARLCETEADTIRALARRMARKRRVVVTVSLSVQRAEHGEQPYWMAVTLAAMLGQIGAEGGGVGLAWGSNGRGYFGRRKHGFSWGRLEQGRNRVDAFIPVARIADMLLQPGEPFRYNGGNHRYPDIRLIYWAGGNPFHHHQDLNRLSQAWERPQTIIVNESVWTATARRADIVFPVTTFLERDDIVCGIGTSITPSHRSVLPFAEARDDYDVFRGLAGRLDAEASFSEGRSTQEWIEHLYDTTRRNASRCGIELPGFQEFWSGGVIDLGDRLPPARCELAEFRRDPSANPLATPSGRIEIYSETIAAFDYEDCGGHPMWFDKQEWLGADTAYPIHLLSPQPRNRLHSQLDFGRSSTREKIDGRQAILINSADARRRGIAPGDTVRVFNERGSLLAGAVLSDDIREHVAQLATGAWYDPEPGSRVDRRGNPNAVSRDRGTSSLAQGPTAQSCLVEIERCADVGPVGAIPPPDVRQHR